MDVALLLLLWPRLLKSLHHLHELLQMAEPGAEV